MDEGMGVALFIYGLANRNNLSMQICLSVYSSLLPENFQRIKPLDIRGRRRYVVSNIYNTTYCINTYLKDMEILSTINYNY